MENYSTIYDNIIKTPNMNPESAPVLKGVKVSLNVANKGKNKDLLGVLTLLKRQYGQRGAITRARESVAAFNVRKDMEIGVLLTLRGRSLENILKIIGMALTTIAPTSAERKYGVNDVGGLTPNADANANANANSKLSGANIEYLFGGKGNNYKELPYKLIMSRKGYGV